MTPCYRLPSSDENESDIPTDNNQHLSETVLPNNPIDVDNIDKFPWSEVSEPVNKHENSHSELTTISSFSTVGPRSSADTITANSDEEMARPRVESKNNISIEISTGQIDTTPKSLNDLPWSENDSSSSEQTSKTGSSSNSGDKNLVPEVDSNSKTD